MPPITGRTKTDEIKLPDIDTSAAIDQTARVVPGFVGPGELDDDRIWRQRFEVLRHDVRELITTLRDTVLPMIDRIGDRIGMLEQDRNELFDRVLQLEAKLAKVV